MVFSRDSHYLVTGSTDQAAVVWDTHSGAEIQRFRRSELLDALAGINAPTDKEGQAKLLLGLRGAMPLCMAPDNRTLLVAYRDQVVKLWDISTGKEVQTYNVWPAAAPVQNTLDLSHHGPHLPGPLGGLLGQKKVLQVDLPEDTVENDYIKKIGAVGKFVPIAERLHEFLSEDPGTELSAISETSLFAVPATADILLAGNDHGVDCIDIATGNVRSNYLPRKKPDARLVRRLGVTPDGRLGIVVLVTGRVETFDTKDGHVVSSQRPFVGDIPTFAVSADGEVLALANSTGDIKVLHVSDLKQISEIKAVDQGEPIHLKLLLSPNGDRVYVSAPHQSFIPLIGGEKKEDSPPILDDVIVTGYDTANGNAAFKMCGLDVDGATFSVDGKYLFTREYLVDTSVGLGKAPSAVNVRLGVPDSIKLLPTVALSGSNLAAAAPNGKLVAMKDSGTKTSLCDRATGMEVFSMRGLADPVVRLMDSPSGLFVAGGTDLSTIYRQMSAAFIPPDAGPTRPLEASDPFSRLLGLSSKKESPWDKALIPEFNPALPPNSSSNGFQALFGSAFTGPANLRLFDVAKATQTAVYVGQSGSVGQAFSISDTGQTIACGGSFFGQISRWTTQSGEPIPNGEVAAQPVLAMAPNGKRSLVMVLGKQPKTVIQDSDGQELAVLKPSEGFPSRAIFNEDGTSILLVYYDHVRRFDVDSKRDLFSNKLKVDVVSDDGRCGLVDDHKNILLYDLENNKKVCALDGDLKLLQAVAESADGARFIVAHSFRLASVFETATGKRLFDLKGHEDHVTGVAFLPDGRIATAALDATVRLWNPDGNEIARFVPLGSRDWLAVTPDGYYTSSRTANQALSFRVDTGCYPFEQFDLRFNRPDYVLKALGSKDDKLLGLYASAYRRRIARAGVTEDALNGTFDRPTLTLQNREAIPYVTEGASVTLDISCSAPAGRTLKYLSVWDNDVPTIKTEASTTVSGKASWSGKLTPLTLSSGGNKLQIVATDSAGVQSLVETVYVKRNSSPKRTLYIVAVGVSEYKDSSHNLKFAAKDSVDIASAFSTGGTGYFSSVKVIDIQDAKATRANILAAPILLAKSTVDDTVVLFFAGHGMIGPDGRYYYGTYDVDFDDPSNPKGRGLSFEEMTGLLKDVPARQRLLLMDTCFAGERDPSAPIPGSASSLAVGVRSVQATGGPSRAGLENTERAMQSLFADLNRGMGAYIVTACGGDQVAIEKNGNGVFTSAILEALKNPDLSSHETFTVTRLRDYVYQRLAVLVGDRQVPGSRQENLALDFRLK
jgi:WD40 repeat protein